MELKRNYPEKKINKTVEFRVIFKKETVISMEFITTIKMNDLKEEHCTSCNSMP